MPESVAADDMARVAVYLDFDNIVISRYDQVHGRNSFQKDKARGLEDDKLTTATVDVISVPAMNGRNTTITMGNSTTVQGMWWMAINSMTSKAIVEISK